MFGKKRIDFLVIGAQKAGTSSLYKYLTENLMIEAATTKEIHYFDFFSDKSKSWYHSHFTFRRNSITGEASPFYLFHPDVPARVKKYNPNMKLIVLLRNPVERAISHYRMNRERGIETRTFTEAIHADETLASSQPDYNQPESALQNFSYKTRGLYAIQLSRWEELWPRKQIMILNYHEFFKDPWQEVQQVYRFLDVAQYFGTSQHFHENRASDTFEISEEDHRYLVEYFREPNRILADQYNIRFE